MAEESMNVDGQVEEPAEPADSTPIIPPPQNDITKSPSKSPKKPSIKSTLSDTVIPSTSLTSVSPFNPWIDLCVSPLELRCSRTLVSGQTFAWREVGVSSSSTSPQNTSPTKSTAWGSVTGKEWVGVLSDRVVHVRETPTSTLCRLLSPLTSGFDLKAFMEDYFNLHVSLGKLYGNWENSAPEAFTREIIEGLGGVRVLNQDPWEVRQSEERSDNKINVLAAHITNNPSGTGFAHRRPCYATSQAATTTSLEFTS